MFIILKDLQKPKESAKESQNKVKERNQKGAKSTILSLNKKSWILFDGGGRVSSHHPKVLISVNPHPSLEDLQ